MARWQNAASGHKMFIAAGSDFSGGKVRGGGTRGEMKRGAETQTSARMGGGGRNYLIAFALERIRSEANCYFLSAVRTILNGHNFSFSSSCRNSLADIRALTSCHVSSNFSNAFLLIVSETTGISDSFKL